MRQHAGALALAAACALTSCGGGPAAPPDDPPDTTAPPAVVAPTSTALDELANARARWAAAGLETYRYLFEDDCGECDRQGPIEAVVWDGDEIDPGSRVPSVEELFATIEAAIADKRSVQIVYDEALGAPLEVSIDMEARAYDGGTHWLVSALQPGLPGDPITLEALVEAEKRWQAARPEAYEYTMTAECDCDFAGSLRTRVDGGVIVGVERAFPNAEPGDISPITIDQVFSDLIDLLSSPDGLVQDGVKFEGSVRFDTATGLPTWIGLDITVLDQSSVLADLPERIVFVIDGFREIESTTEFGDLPNDGEAALARWEQVGLLDYRYELTVHDIATGDFSNPYLVTVRDGRVDSVTAGGAEVSTVGLPAFSVDDVFERLELWRQQGSRVEAIFDIALGHPVIVSVYPVDATPEDVLFFSIDNLEELD